MWSPDGTKIVYEREAGSDHDLWTMNPDGTGNRRHSTNTPGVRSPTQLGSLCPYPVNGVRPKGAAYVRVPLVPAFLPCQTPSHTHGAPLAEPSCAPPQRPSSGT